MFYKKNAKVHMKDGRKLSETTVLCIASHQDDIEIMAYSSIADCFGKPDKWFCGCVVTDGAGSPRSGVYANFSDEQMKEVRAVEQKTASEIGGYLAQVLLNYQSSEVKSGCEGKVTLDLIKLIEETKPDIILTHNIADKHDTHVAVALRVIEAVKKASHKATKVFGCEVWRGLDWLCDEDKTVFDTSAHPNLAASLLGVFDSQICGGKRYDLATLGRRLSNATFFASHDTDDVESCSYALDMTELCYSDTTPIDFTNKYIDRFKAEVNNTINKYM